MDQIQPNFSIIKEGTIDQLIHYLTSEEAGKLKNKIKNK